VVQVERLLYELNRENLVHTTISYSGPKNEGFLTFNPESQVAENLFNFGQQLHQIFKLVEESHSQAKQQRTRVFQKVKEKLDEEAHDIKIQQQEMIEAKKQLVELKKKEREEADQKRKREQERKGRE